jgi:hypothetical protein
MPGVEIQHVRYLLAAPIYNPIVTIERSGGTVIPKKKTLDEHIPCFSEW